MKSGRVANGDEPRFRESWVPVSLLAILGGAIVAVVVALSVTVYNQVLDPAKGDVTVAASVLGVVGFFLVVIVFGISKYNVVLSGETLRVGFRLWILRRTMQVSTIQSVRKVDMVWYRYSGLGVRWVGHWAYMPDFYGSGIRLTTTTSTVTFRCNDPDGLINALGMSDSSEGA